MIACDIQPVQNLKVLRKAMALVAEDAKTATKMDWGRTTIEDGFDAVEAVLKESAGEFCVGDAPSIADACLVPQVYNARRFKVDMGRYPTISRVEANASRLPAFVDAHPSNQPDAEQ